ncbi:hypothetical protein AB0C38_24080 [Amycolatopsis sp. NPDC048633]|uniref:hypothetical protein n=1 Tax=Amycolatopsis sp. NPDC048633 TaxID=3157095 RepID=UPI0033C560DB
MVRTVRRYTAPLVLNSCTNSRIVVSPPGTPPLGPRHRDAAESIGNLKEDVLLTGHLLHYDGRGVCRAYEMAMSDHEWKLWRNADPHPQRFMATISPDGNTITGRWEKATDGETWETDLDLIYRRAT